MEKSRLDELENALYELTDKEANKALQFLFWRAYESDDLDLYNLLKRSIEYGGKKFEI